MKILLLLVMLCFTNMALFAQFENSTEGVRFDATETNLENPTGLELPAIKKPSLSNPNTNSPNSDLGDDKKEPLDITKGDGLLDYNSGKAPKYFTQDKALSEIEGGDQYLGDFKTTSGFVSVQYRDHEYVDGDVIRVFVNDDVVQSSIYLNGVFQGFKLSLVSGFNKIDFQALNQGSSGPNTAELHVYDDTGKLVSAYKWNLLTGDKATVIVVKE
ncbi:hypothetical protein ATE92_2302 [Ulvibacter sp. MAR_2010_11]|uniref:hypothetical protein n=1 Tax=Ulvibacter sp. MAR_2010_11 TaxID=1250229 RepID=UPI000C2B9A5F|nr:hypothetical protein [Ulvibacter sp. MAR_2010_11]PKA84132.1 hypothetical protein ATE92_2302 [Ulvibacter sp. MAR_2010_11]